MLDIGCSRGDSLAPYIAEFGERARYVGVEVSQPMLEAVRKRFAGECRDGVVEIQELDLRESFPAVRASLTLSVLTLQFVPVEHRGRVVRDAYDHTVDGGAFVLVEKILGNSPQMTELLIDHYHELKHANGYSREAIERKRLSLEGVLVPATAAWNEDLLRSRAFRRSSASGGTSTSPPGSGLSAEHETETCRRRARGATAMAAIVCPPCCSRRRTRSFRQPPATRAGEHELRVRPRNAH